MHIFNAMGGQCSDQNKFPMFNEILFSELDEKYITYGN